MEKSIAISNVLLEREMQDQKWGEQNHAPPIWLMILGEEVGEANKAVLEARTNYSFDETLLLNYRDEMVQVAAVAAVSPEDADGNVLLGADLPPEVYARDFKND